MREGFKLSSPPAVTVILSLFPETDQLFILGIISNSFTLPFLPVFRHITDSLFRKSPKTAIKSWGGFWKSITYSA